MSGDAFIPVVTRQRVKEGEGPPRLKLGRRELYFDIINNDLYVGTANGPAVVGGPRLILENGVIKRQVEQLAVDLSTAETTLRAEFTEQIETLVTATEAQAQRVTELEAEILAPGVGVKARIEAEETARATADEALAQRATTLEAELDTPVTGVKARLTTEETARATADEALAQRATALEAKTGNGAGSLGARIAAEETARATADEALAQRTTTLEAKTGNGAGSLGARIAAEETARATADEAAATRTGLLEARVSSASPYPAMTVPNVHTYYTDQYNIAPDLAESLAPSLIRTVPGEGPVLLLTASVYVAGKAVRRIEPDRSYQIVARVRRTINPADGDNRVRLYFGKLSDTYAYSNGNPATIADEVNVGDGFVPVKSNVVTGAALLAASPGAVYVRPLIRNGSAGQAANSGEMEVAYFDLLDVTEAAAAEARIATEETARATADAALAVRATTVEATASAASQGGLLKDPTFNDWPASSARPTSVGAPVGGVAITRQTAALFYGDKALRLQDTSLANGYAPIEANAQGPASDNEWWVCEYVVTVNSGDLRRFGAQLRLYREGGGYYVAMFDLAANHPVSLVGATYRGAKLAKTAGAGSVTGAPTHSQSYFYTNLSSFSGGAFSAKNITLHKLQYRPATAEEIAAGEAIPLLTSRVTDTETAIANADGLLASWKRGTAVPGASTFIEAVSRTVLGGAPSSSVGIGAKLVAIYNQLGDDWKKALEVVGGNVILTGGLQAGAFIRLGNGNGWPVALKNVDFSVADGGVVNFGTDLGALPALTFAMNNLAPLNAGESYNVYADNLSATGFTLRAKINVPATPSDQTLNGPGAGVTLGGKVGRQLLLGSTPVSASGEYTISFGGYTEVRVPRYTNVSIYEGQGNVTIYVRKNGVWSVAAPVYYSWSQGLGNGSAQDQWQTVGWTGAAILQLGGGVEGIAAVVATDAEGGINRTTSLGNLGPITWQSQGSGSSIRSATPNGQKTRVTVRPQ